MAPEQVEAKEVDARTDIFAFGAVVYEMATGKKAFEGKTQASLIAKILETDPPPMSSLQPMTPPALDRVVKKCLAKEPEKRWQAASDVCDELKWIAEGGSQAGMPAPVAASRKSALGDARLAWIVAAVFFLAALALGYFVYFQARSATGACCPLYPFPARQVELGRNGRGDHGSDGSCNYFARWSAGRIRRCKRGRQVSSLGPLA